MFNHPKLLMENGLIQLKVVCQLRYDNLRRSYLARLNRFCEKFVFVTVSQNVFISIMLSDKVENFELTCSNMVFVIPQFSLTE